MKVFNVGDKARVRKDLVGGEIYDTCTSGGCYCTETMTNYAGSVVVVSGKNGSNGFMDLRKVEDGFTTTMPFSWSDGMLEPLEEKQPHGFLTVGSVVKIRSDIAKRVDKKNRIWITLNGKKHASLPVSDKIKESGGKMVVITEVLPRPGHMDGCAYRARFVGAAGAYGNIAGTFDITMFDCLGDWLEAGKTPDDDEPKTNFKVGDKVVIKTTVSSGERIDHITIQPFMFNQAYDKSDPLHPRRRIGIVEWVYGSGTAEGIGTLEISFECDDRSFTWPQKAFELYNEDNDNPNPSKKQPTKKKKPDSKVDYSGYTPKSEFCVYDYLNRAGKFVPSEKSFRNITKIEVTVMSGDETGCFYGVYNGNPWQYKFDVMESSRFASYDDGSYTVEGKENIEKWINWSYDPEKAIYAEYSMERMRAFRKRE